MTRTFRQECDTLPPDDITDVGIPMSFGPRLTILRVGFTHLRSDSKR